jgi:hypothetical protein
MSEYYVTKATYEKNATNGLEIHESKQALADAVLEIENSGGSVQVFRCVPVDHEVYTTQAGIHIYEENHS